MLQIQMNAVLNYILVMLMILCSQNHVRNANTLFVKLVWEIYFEY